MKVAAIAVLCALVAGGCSKGNDYDSDVHPVTTLADTLPSEVADGTAILLLAGKAHHFQVDCGPDSSTTTAPGVATQFEMRGAGTGADAGTSIFILRQQTNGVSVTTTDTVTYKTAKTTIEAQRVAFAGTFVDLRQANVDSPLLDIEGPVVRAKGILGPVGSTTASSLLTPGQLLGTCSS